MNEKLEQLNQILPETARISFRSCCGSERWAQKMTEARPFTDVADLLDQAENIWQNLSAADWLEAFAAHPKIGARQAAAQATAKSAEWSDSEQSGTRAANDSVIAALAEANRLYENKFGFIFIVCATGKAAEEMLEICRERLGNDADQEIFNAAAEQNKITKLRLQKLLQADIE